MTDSLLATLRPEELAQNLFQVQHHDFLRAILDSISEGIIIADTSGNFVYYSPFARKLIGPQLQQSSPESWSQDYGIFHPDMRTPFPSEQLPLYRALQGEEAPSAEFFVRDTSSEGLHLHANATPVRDEQGRLLGAMAFVRDVSQQRQAEAEQRRTEQRFRLLVETAQEGIWTINAEGRTNYINRYMAELLGHTVDELMGAPAFDFFDEEGRERLGQQLARRRQGQAGIQNFKFQDFKLQHKDGRAVWVMLSSSPMHDEEGRYVGSLAMITDVTQRREAEAQVRQLNEELERRIAQRTAQLEFSNRELEAFAYSVAHDLRAPLRSISNFSLALNEDCGDRLDDTGVDYLRRIRASSQRMSELIDGILTLSRVTRTEFVETEVDLSALARTIAEQLQRWQPERAVRFRIQEGLVERGDAQLLRSVLENLLGNAWKFTRERPVAEIEFGALPAGEGGGRALFVRDDGAGFDMAFGDKLFGVFQRLHTQQEFEGTGVGLATVQRIIQRHGGRVWGEGRVGEGATIYFTLHEPPPCTS